jgi:hypothetical protein
MQPPATIRLRPALAADAAELRAILLDTFESTWRPNITTAAAEAFLTEDRPRAFVAERGLGFWVAERDGRVGGLIIGKTILFTPCMCNPAMLAAVSARP